MERILGEHPFIEGLHKRVKERPRIAEYLKSDRRKPFSSGIYRHYEELDDPEEDWYVKCFEKSREPERGITQEESKKGARNYVLSNIR